MDRETGRPESKLGGKHIVYIRFHRRWNCASECWRSMSIHFYPFLFSLKRYVPCKIWHSSEFPAMSMKRSTELPKDLFVSKGTPWSVRSEEGEAAWWSCHAMTIGLDWRKRWQETMILDNCHWGSRQFFFRYANSDNDASLSLQLSSSNLLMLH